MNINKTSSSKSHTLIASADDIDIYGPNLREVSAVFSRIEKEPAKVGLAVNEHKTMLTLSTSKSSTQLDQCVNIDNVYNFEVVDDFIYLIKNNASLEIK